MIRRSLRRRALKIRKPVGQVVAQAHQDDDIIRSERRGIGEGRRNGPRNTAAMWVVGGRSNSPIGWPMTGAPRTTTTRSIAASQA